MAENMVDKLMEKLKFHANETQKIYYLLSQLKQIGEADFELPNLTTFFGSDVGIPATSSTIRVDEFHRLKHTDAAERYLRKIGHAVPLDEIYSALIEGGAIFSGDGKRSLTVQLTRATRKFSKIGTGKDISFGLIEWYPKRKARMLRPIDTSEIEDSEEQEKDTK
jgi:hypothetical protein